MSPSNACSRHTLPVYRTAPHGLPHLQSLFARTRRFERDGANSFCRLRRGVVVVALVFAGVEAGPSVASARADQRAARVTASMRQLFRSGSLNSMVYGVWVNGRPADAGRAWERAARGARHQEDAFSNRQRD